MWSVARGRVGGLFLAATLLSAGSLQAQASPEPGEPESPWTIHLKARTFVPTPGVEPALREDVRKAGRGTLGLVQLEDVPDETVRAQLERAGVELLEYIPNNTWIARLPADLDKAASVLTVRWVGRLQAGDKLTPDLARAAADKKGKPGLLLNVEAVPGALEAAAAQVRALGGRVRESDDAMSVLRVDLPRSAVLSLAGSDAVLWISIDPPRALFNDRLRINARGNQAQASPYGLTGGGVQLGMWDGGEVFTHTDFTGRLTRNELGGPPAGQDHATHVAGTMAGSGARSQALGFAANRFRGFANGAQIVSYIFDGNPPAEHNAAINTWGIDLSQNSWGARVSTADNNCTLFGDYETVTREYDRIVTGLYTRRIPIIFAAGNDRDDLDCSQSTVPPYLNYRIIPPPGAAKNVITVGAINGDNSAMTAFSSWGPTDDGRLKPELVAGGCNATANGMPFAAVYSTIPTNGYGPNCGTSMAAPAVSGSIGLLLQRYRAVCPASPADPLPSTVKALLIHTARDLDDTTSYLNPGPDFASGYGALDTQAAVDMVPFHREDQVGNGQTDTFQITVTQQSQLKVTLAWDDPAAAVLAGTTLVNNLNLELVDPNGTVYRPWILNAANPAANATRGVDNRNVVEQVVVDTVDRVRAGVWTIRVIGATVPSGPQRYSLVTQHLRPADVSCQGAPAGDVWIMDKDAPLQPVDTGAEPNPDNGPMWISNQIWVRHAGDGVMAHQNPDAGNDNYIYARVRNRGNQTLNTVRAMIYVANASAGLSWPKDWTLLGEKTLVNLAPGTSRLIDPLVWKPSQTGHFCLYVRLVSDQDPIGSETAAVYANAQSNNEIAWRNVNIVDVRANRSAAGSGKNLQMAEVRLANTEDGEAQVQVNFDLAPDEKGATLLDFATVKVILDPEAFQAHYEELGLDFSTFGGLEGFERIDDATFQMVSPTAYFTPIPFQGPKELTVQLHIESNGKDGPSPVYTLDVNQNFPPVSGGSSSSAGAKALKAFSPEDPNVGGVRYEVLIPAGTGSVSGTVTDGQANPLPGVSVTLGGAGSRSTVTDEQGQFQFLGVAAGPWGLRAELEGFGAETAAVLVPNGGNTVVDLVLPEGPIE